MTEISNNLIKEIKSTLKAAADVEQYQESAGDLSDIVNDLESMIESLEEAENLEEFIKEWYKPLVNLTSQLGAFCKDIGDIDNCPAEQTLHRLELAELGVNI